MLTEISIAKIKVKALTVGGVELQSTLAVKTFCFCKVNNKLGNIQTILGSSEL